MKYHTGPFVANSKIYKFCEQHKILISFGYFHELGHKHFATLNDEEATVFKLTFPNYSFWETEDD